MTPSVIVPALISVFVTLCSIISYFLIAVHKDIKEIAKNMQSVRETQSAYIERIKALEDRVTKLESRH